MNEARLSSVPLPVSSVAESLELSADRFLAAYSEDRDRSSVNPGGGPMLVLSLLLHDVRSATACGNFSRNCEECLGLGKRACGWCRDDVGHCWAGKANGPTNRTCGSWTYTFTTRCHLESTAPLRVGARVGILIAVGVVAIATAVFWISIYPRISGQADADKDNDDESPEDE
jgi:hypothetical protein